jgi:branched-subunit amino acid transport protein
VERAKVDVNLWAVMVSAGALTFLTRLSFIALAGRWDAPPLFRSALRFVPVAILTAIVLPELVMHTGKVDFSLTNPRLLAGALAILVAWRTKNTVLTIVIGMTAFWVLQWIIK